jgi:hypothetical protein
MGEVVTSLHVRFYGDDTPRSLHVNGVTVRVLGLNPDLVPIPGPDHDSPLKALQFEPGSPIGLDEGVRGLE